MHEYICAPLFRVKDWKLSKFLSQWNDQKNPEAIRLM